MCEREYTYRFGGGYNKSKCNGCRVNQNRAERKQKAINYKGGYFRCSKALSFHHLDPTKKDFQISGNHCRAWSVIQIELDKCLLVCANCHAEIHAGLHKELHV